jgi:hypothetical protein
MNRVAADYAPNVDKGHRIGTRAGLAVTPGELGWVAIVAVIILAVSCLPYLVGYLATPPDRVFGGFLLDELDSNAYLAKMQQGARGQWTATLLHTPEDHPALVLYLFYLALGHLAARLDLPLILVYHVARIVCGLILLLSLYLFLSLFLAELQRRRLAYLLAAIGSGLGWLIAAIAGSLALGGISPIDFWLMEAYVFFTLFLFPQSALAMALLLGLLGGMAFFFDGTSGWRPWLFALGCGLALALLNPYVLVVAGIVLGGYWLVVWVVRHHPPRREGLALAALGLFLVPHMAYYALQFYSHPVWRSFLDQDVVPSPAVWYYVAGYGLIFLLALPGAWDVLRRRDQRQLLLIAWPVMALLAVYVPLSGQRRMVFGAVIPLSALAAIGLLGVVVPWVQGSRPAAWLAARGYSRERLGWLLVAFTVALASISNLFLVASSTLSATLGHPDVTQPVAVEEAIAWLGQHSAPDAVVLSSYRVGNIIPARVGRRVVWGHWDETAFYREKEADVTAFFDGATPDVERQDILRRYEVDYVFHGPREQELGRFKPSADSYLDEVYRNQEVVIYQVELE